MIPKVLSFFQGSRSRSVPVHLYEAVYGSGPDNRILLTDAEEPVVIRGETYQVAQIKHGEVHASGTLDKTSIDVTTRYDSPLSELFRHYPPSRVVTLTIKRGERDDPEQDFYTIWSGRVLSCNLEAYEAKLTCEPVGTGVRRPGLRRNYQLGCPHVLYGPSCRADRQAFTSTAVVENFEGSSIRVAAGWNGDWNPAQFINGIASWVDPSGGEIVRTILQIAGDTDASSLLLAGNLTGLKNGVSVDLSLGCSHQLTDCTNVFDNGPNYGGCPWIPTKNPVGSYNPFY